MQPDYDRMSFRRCGRSGLVLPAISLGLWHNFGSVDPFDVARGMVRRAFELGITHFDLANNYGPDPGSAEQTFGRILRRDLAGYRDSLIVSTKAGYRMWAGPYGDGGSRKYLIASLDQSLRRLGLEYVDVFYHHRPDPDTPIEETMLALAHIVAQGKALYVGLSNYDAEMTRAAARILRELRVPLVLHQPKYNMFERHAAEGLFDVLREEGIGCIAFSPLAQGLLAGRYRGDIPAGSRAANAHGALSASAITADLRRTVMRLDDIAADAGRTTAQLALAWVLRSEVMASAIIGASSVSQIEENVGAAGFAPLSADELSAIDAVVLSS